MNIIKNTLKTACAPLPIKILKAAGSQREARNAAALPRTEVSAGSSPAGAGELLTGLCPKDIAEILNHQGTKMVPVFPFGLRATCPTLSRKPPFIGKGRQRHTTRLIGVCVCVALVLPFQNSQVTSEDKFGEVLEWILQCLLH